MRRLIPFLLLLAACGGPELPTPRIEVAVRPEPVVACLTVQHDVTITTNPVDTTIWTVRWLDVDKTIEAGVAEPGEVGQEELYLPTWTSTVVEIEAWAIHGVRVTGYVAKNGPEDFQWLWDVPGCEWLRELAAAAGTERGGSR
jgi:hypothetical protein